MSKQSFPEAREKLYVGKAEHVLQVTHGNDGELYAVCYHPTDKMGMFPMRFTKHGRTMVTVTFHSMLHDATADVDKRIAANLAEV